MVSDHALDRAFDAALDRELRERLERYNRRSAHLNRPPLSYAEARADFLLPALDSLTPVRQEQAAAGIAALEAGRDLIICGGTSSGRTALAQGVISRLEGGLYIGTDGLEFGGELRGSSHLEWNDEASREERIGRASSLCFDELWRGPEPELSRLVGDKPLAVVVHAMRPLDSFARFKSIGFEREWKDPVILYCRREDRLPVEEKQEIWDREDRERAERRNAPSITNGLG